MPGSQLIFLVHQEHGRQSLRTLLSQSMPYGSYLYQGINVGHIRLLNFIQLITLYAWPKEAEDRRKNSDRHYKILHVFSEIYPQLGLDITDILTKPCCCDCIKPFSYIYKCISKAVMENITIRTARPEDFQEILQWMVDEGWNSISANLLEATLQWDPQGYLVAEDASGQLIGTLYNKLPTVRARCTERLLLVWNSQVNYIYSFLCITQWHSAVAKSRGGEGGRV